MHYCLAEQPLSAEPWACSCGRRYWLNEQGLWKQTMNTASMRLVSGARRSMLIRRYEHEPRSWIVVVDDGFRLWGRCLSVDKGEPWVIIEYKHSEIPTAAYALIDLLFRDWT
jgi:hypothetical protein